MSATLGQLAEDFLGISLLAIGAGITTVPEMHRNVVDIHAWMSSAQFAELFALSQAAPGPTTTMLSVLIGWKVAGWWGALVSVLALLDPACVLMYFVAQAWDRFRDAPWREWVQAGLMPVTIGLMFSAGWLITRGAAQTWQALALTGATAALTLATRVNPLWLIATGVTAGLIGWA